MMESVATANENAPARLVSRPSGNLDVICPAPTLEGGTCGKVLGPRRKKFCSDVCCARSHDAKHPRMNPPGTERLSPEPIWEQILGLLSLPKGHADYKPQWRTADLAFRLRVDGGTASRELRKVRANIRRDCECSDGCTCPVMHVGRPDGHRKPAVFWLTGVFHGQPAEQPAGQV